MKFKKTIIPLTLVLSLVIPSIAYAASGSIIQLHGGDKYVKQHQSNWCWAATGLNIFVAIDETVPSSKSEEEFLLELVKDVVKNDELPINPGNTDYIKYNISAGLTQTSEIASTLLEENGYSDIFYKLAENNGPVVRSFNYIMSDLKDGYPMGIWLSSKKSGQPGHIVLINGADSTVSNYEIRVFEPSRGSNLWVTYDDLIEGTSIALSGKYYNGTCEVQIK